MGGISVGLAVTLHPCASALQVRMGPPPPRVCAIAGQYDCVMSLSLTVELSLAAYLQQAGGR